MGEDGPPTGAMERIALPREWDAEATVKAMQDHA